MGVCPAWTVSPPAIANGRTSSERSATLRSTCKRAHRIQHPHRRPARHVIFAAAGDGFGDGDDAVPEAAHVLDIDMNLPVSALPLLDAAAETAKKSLERAGKLHGTRCSVIAHTFTNADWQWAVDQAVYDTGVRVFVTSRDALRRRALDGRLPSDARYWAVLPAATLSKRADRVARALRSAGGTVEMAGIVDDAETLGTLGAAAGAARQSGRRGSPPPPRLPLLIGGSSAADCVAMAREATTRWPGVRVAGVMFDARVAASVGDRGVAGFVADVLRECEGSEEKEEEERSDADGGGRDRGRGGGRGSGRGSGGDGSGSVGVRAPLLALAVGSDFAGEWRDLLARPSLHKKCRVVLYTPVFARA